MDNIINQCLDRFLLRILKDEFLENGYVNLPNFFSKTDILSLVSATSNLVTIAKTFGQNFNDTLEHRQFLTPGEAGPIFFDSAAHQVQGAQLVVQNNGTETIIKRIVSAGSYDKICASIFNNNSNFLQVIGYLLGASKASHLINSFHPKLPYDNVEFTIHQDIFHRKNFASDWKNVNGDLTYIACITAIEKITAANGPLVFVPKSHKLGELNSIELNNLDLSTKLVVELDPGETACWNQYLVHFSEPNYSNHSRYAIINGYAHRGATNTPCPGKISGEIIDLLNDCENT